MLEVSSCTQNTGWAGAEVLQKSISQMILSLRTEWLLSHFKFTPNTVPWPTRPCINGPISLCWTSSHSILQPPLKLCCSSSGSFLPQGLCTSSPENSFLQLFTLQQHSSVSIYRRPSMNRLSKRPHHIPNHPLSQYPVNFLSSTYPVINLFHY